MGGVNPKVIIGPNWQYQASYENGGTSKKRFK